MPAPKQATTGAMIPDVPQLRISARVQNKQKKDDKVEAQSSNEIKKVDGNSQDEDEEEEVGCLDEEKDFKGDGKKRRRAWELWSMEDKKAFFEAINECGKDFESIQNYLVAKLRKKGSTNGVIKNKDQVRHFYYRTWHKISKHVKFSNDVKKATQELYALINYGELRRKVGGTLDEKKGQKLQELIQKGSTSVRVKGKSIRVRTPICRALKKLNEFQDDKEQFGSRVPMSIQVDLLPRTMETWNTVQSLSHNPRLRVVCSMHKPITQLVDHLQNKWRSHKLKIRNRLVNGATFPVEVSNVNPLFLRLVPPRDAVINRVRVQPDSQVKSTAVSLLSHEEMLLKKSSDTTATSKKERGRKGVTSVKSPPLNQTEGKRLSEELDECGGGELSQEDTEGSDMEFEDEGITEVNKSKSFFSLNHNRIKEEPMNYLSNSEEEDDEEIELLTPFPQMKIKQEDTESSEALHQLMALENVASSNIPQDDDEVVCLGENTRLLAQVRDDNKHDEEHKEAHKHRDDERSQEDSEQPLDDEDKTFGDTLFYKENYQEYEKEIRQGWTAKSCATVTVGQLYLMFGSDHKISLEYEFEDEMDYSSTVQLDMECSVILDGDGNQSNNQANDEKKSNDELSKSETADSMIFNPITTDTTVSSIGTLNTTSNTTSTITGLPLPDLVDCKVQTEEERKKKIGDLSSMLNHLFFLMKSLSSPEGCFCRPNSLAKTPTGNLRSPVGMRCGGIGRSPNSTKSPRGLSSTRSPRTPTSSFSKSPGNNPFPRNEKTKPASAKRLLPDIADKVSTSQTNLEKYGRKEGELDVQTGSENLAGEFRIPIAPAPKNICQTPNSNFNAQLTKLLPRYSMPSRRAIRKSVVVQRHLPLLPRTPLPQPGFVTLKVLPHQNNMEGLNYSSNARKLPPLGVKIPTAPPSTMLPSSQVEPKSICSSSSSIIEKSQPILVQHIAMSTPVLSAPSIPPQSINNSMISNAISVNVSGHQLLTVKMPNVPLSDQNLTPTPPILSTTPMLSPINDRNLSLPSPIFSSAPLILSSTPSIISNSCAMENNKTINNEIDNNSISLTPKPSISIPISENNDSLSRFFAESVSDMPYLNVASSAEELNIPKDFKGVFTSSISPNFDSALNLITTSTDLGSTESQLSVIAPSETSLLNTPVHLPRDDSRVPQKDLEMAKLNITSLFTSHDEVQNEEEIPQIHIPESNLPLLDISLGGTVSVCPSTKSTETLGSNVLHSSNTELSLSVTCVTTSSSDTKTTASISIIDPTLQSAFQDTSCDKIMDITLANSNSNSTFSSLLAAATGPTQSLETLMENSASQSRRAMAKGHLSLGQEPFESLSAAPPSPPSSPSRLLRHADAQWLHQDANEFSLSSLLGTMESPIKGGPTNSHPNDGLSPPQSLISATLNDNTVDFTATFAQLKKQTKENSE